MMEVAADGSVTDVSTAPPPAVCAEASDASSVHCADSRALAGPAGGKWAGVPCIALGLWKQSCWYHRGPGETFPALLPLNRGVL